MAKDWFPFYPDIWLGGTMGMSLEEKGAYFELLLMQWQCHRIAVADAKKLVGEGLWGRLWPKFEKDEQGFFNKRLDEVRAKVLKKNKQQRENALKRWKKPPCHGNATAMPTHYDGNATAMPTDMPIQKTTHIYSNTVLSINDNTINTNNDRLKKKREEFVAEVEKLALAYDSDIRQTFCDYWLEMNKRKTKFRFEDEKFFDFKKRLNTFAHNRQRYGAGQKPNPLTEKFDPNSYTAP